jgi:hypothetical protein
MFAIRRVLFIDAATCLVMGAVLLAAAGALASLLALPDLLLRYAGLSLLPIAAFMAWVATRSPLPRAGAWLVVAGNVLWVAASIGLLLGAWVSPNALGYGFVLAQAACVALLAALEYAGLRSAR